MKRSLVKSWVAAVVFAGAALAALAALATPASNPPNLGRALAAQQQLAAERPGDASVFNDLGNLLILGRDLDGAEAAYRRAIELAPAMAPVHFNLALLLQQRRERQEAMKEYREVLAIDGDHAWAWYQVGSLHEQAGDERRAIRAYARAFALEPRLAFPDYNPQVLENHLVAKAMLRGYRGGEAAPQAPKIYQDPARIAGLLLPSPPPGEAEAAAGGEVEPPASPPDVLSGEDLDTRGAVNQAAPAESGVYRPPSAVPQRRTTVRTWSGVQGEDASGRPAGSGVAPGQVVVPGQVIVPGAPVQPRVETPPGTTVYRPGVESTGRLDLELLPGPAERAG